MDFACDCVIVVRLDERGIRLLLKRLQRCFRVQTAVFACAVVPPFGGLDQTRARRMIREVQAVAGSV